MKLLELKSIQLWDKTSIIENLNLIYVPEYEYLKPTLNSLQWIVPLYCVVKYREI